MLFLQTGVHSILQSKEPKHSQNKLPWACTHTHTHTQQNSLKRRDFKDDFKNVSMFDDLTLQGRPFLTTLRNNPVRPLASSQSIIVHVPVCVHVPACVCVCVPVKVLRTASMDKTLYKYFTYYYYYYSMLCYFDWRRKTPPYLLTTSFAFWVNPCLNQTALTGRGQSPWFPSAASAPQTVPGNRQVALLSARRCCWSWGNWRCRSCPLSPCRCRCPSPCMACCPDLLVKESNNNNNNNEDFYSAHLLHKVGVQRALW